MKVIKMLMVAICLVFVTGVAKADTFQFEAPMVLKAEPQPDGGFKIILEGNLCVQDLRLIAYHQDSMRGMNVRKAKIDPVQFSDNCKAWIIPGDTVKLGQVMFNFYSSGINRWAGIPNCLITLGPGLAYNNSTRDDSITTEGTWDSPTGGVGFFITAAGFPIDKPLYINCAAPEPPKPAAPMPAPAPRPVAAPPAPAPRADMTQNVIKSPDSQNVQSKQVAKNNTKIKGNNNTVVNVIKQQKNITNQKGSTVKVKGNNNQVKACTFNFNTTYQIMGNSDISKVDSNNCGGCHNPQVWPKLEKAIGHADAFGNRTTSDKEQNMNINNSDKKSKNKGTTESIQIK